MAKNNLRPEESPEETRAEAEAQARAAEEAARAEAEAKAGTEAAEKTSPALIRHKTPYEKYRCAGLVLTKKPETYRVTEAQLEQLRRDPWVAVEKENGPK